MEEGKTTIAASLAIAATHERKRVLVVTIDPAKRLAEAFGYSLKDLESSGEPLALSPAVKTALNIPADASLSVGLLNPKYVLDQILEQVLTPEQATGLKKTQLFTHLSEMIYGLQEYTAYEWVTRMIQKNEFDFIVLDTPPAFHAKDFFNVPEKIKNLMESKVFQLFAPKKHTWFTTLMSFSWLEKLLGEKIFHESRIFFETFAALRTRILERCEWLSRFFSQKEVSVLAVSTPESSALFELEGLVSFLNQKNIPIESIILNQVEQKPEYQPSDYASDLESQGGLILLEKVAQIHSEQVKRAEKAFQTVERCRIKYDKIEILSVPMTYAEEGFTILSQASAALITKR